MKRIFILSVVLCLSGCYYADVKPNYNHRMHHRYEVHHYQMHFYRPEEHRISRPKNVKKTVPQRHDGKMSNPAMNKKSRDKSPSPVRSHDARRH